MASNSWWSSGSSNEEEMFFRKRCGAHEKLVNDYFSDAPLYNADIFRRRFRMSRRLFTQIADDLVRVDPFFTQEPDARNYEGFTTLQKCTAAIRQLAYGTVADALDEYLQMSAKTTRECLYRICHNVVKLYSKKYLRKPNAYDVQQLYQAHEARHGFPEMLGSIDCMHWAWHNCPTAWRGQYTRGSLNDLNVLYQSMIFSDVVNGTGPDTRFTVSGVECRRGYYLANGKYPSWSTIIKTIPFPEDEKRKKFAKRQEAARKDTERRAICEYDENASYGNTLPVEPTQQDLNSSALTNDYTHANLQQDLVEHIWNNANDGDGDEDEDE
ncbi:uncharacterized protein LOC110930613 [Helianthus annuus]|uniref:uncharacterized protein LOC110930613 n=1 Tax=Helianthus annuus TaxID=4232 RepID=UPI000B8F135A|nr:uncharacterized protein LOC110930613 [Helianthus annuus]